MPILLYLILLVKYKIENQMKIISELTENQKQMLVDLNNSFTVGNIYTTSELSFFLDPHELFSIKNVAAYSYNRWNKGMNHIFPVLEWLTRGSYKFLGYGIDYNGIITHYPKGDITYKIGEWIKGDYTLYNEFNSFEDWAKSNYEGIKIAEKNSKIIFESLDGKISQKKNLIESKDDSVQFIEGYSLTLIDSPLGKLLRFKTEGDIFKFGENEFIIKSIS